MAAFWVLTWPWLCAHFEKQGDRERENSGVSSSYKDTVPLQLGSYLYNSWNTYFHQEVKLLSHVWLFVIPWTVAYQAPLPVEFSWQECWSELPFPSVVDLPDLGIELISVQFIRSVVSDSLRLHGLKSCLLHCRQTLYPLSHQGSPIFIR